MLNRRRMQTLALWLALGGACLHALIPMGDMLTFGADADGAPVALVWCPGFAPVVPDSHDGGVTHHDALPLCAFATAAAPGLMAAVARLTPPVTMAVPIDTAQRPAPRPQPQRRPAARDPPVSRFTFA